MDFFCIYSAARDTANLVSSELEFEKESTTADANANSETF